MYLW